MDHSILNLVTLATRKADKHFERVGGSSRHWARDCFLPELERHGFKIEKVELNKQVEGLAIRRKSMIELGDKVKDILTALEGVAIGKTEWLHGCTTYGIQPQTLQNGKTIDAQWFDEGRLEVIKEPVQTHTENHKKNGGPQDTPQRNLAGC